MKNTKAVAYMIHDMSTAKLIETFIQSGKMIDAGTDPEMYTVRGWLLDELERRDPEAFDRWLEADGLPTDESLYDYYSC